MAMLPMLRGTAWVFFSVALIAALDWFRTWLPKDSVEGVSGVWANAGEPATKRETNRKVPPKNSILTHFVGLELELWEE
jgi:hypothetical protein